MKAARTRMWAARTRMWAARTRMKAARTRMWAARTRMKAARTRMEASADQDVGSADLGAGSAVLDVGSADLGAGSADPACLGLDAPVGRGVGSPPMARPTKEPRPARPSAKESAPPPSPRSFGGFSEVTSFLWSVADLLRGDYKQADYGKVILPLTVLRRLDCVLDRTKAKVLAKHAELKTAKHPEGTIEKMLVRATGVPFYNTSKLDFEKLKGDPNHIAANLTSYIKGFSAERARRHRRSSSSPTTSPSSTRRTCSSRSSPASPTWTSTPRRCRTTSWAPSSRS